MIIFNKAFTKINNFIINNYYLGLPIAVFIWLSSFLFHWQIDDAGIVFAYSRNIAAGFGIVSQPHLTPVEGCTNFLWMIFLVPFFWIGAFSPIITSKILGIILTFCSFLIIKHILEKEGISKIIITGILMYLSTSSSLVIWLTSGLENSLFLVLILLLFLKIGNAIREETYELKSTYLIPILSFCIFLTRPDGIMYGIAYPLSILMMIILAKLKLNKKIIFSLILNILVLFLLVIGFELFRKLYFGEWVPNTYYAKVGSSYENLLNLITFNEIFKTKLFNLINSITLGEIPLFYIFVFIILQILLIVKNKINSFTLVLFILMYLSLISYMILPNDWMREFRFATSFLVLFLTAFILSFYYLFNKIKLPYIVIFYIVIGYFHINNQFPRLHNFQQNPDIPFLQYLMTCRDTISFTVNL
jgi:hypothetical protein